MIRRASECNDFGGRHFEHLLQQELKLLNSGRVSCQLQVKYYIVTVFIV
jgi:hypothetical protein